MANTQQNQTRNNPQDRTPQSMTRRMIDAEREHQYWSRNFAKQNEYEPGRAFEDYEGAYRTGYEGYTRYPDKTYGQAENDLKRDYERLGKKAALTWDNAKAAVRAGWQRVEQAIPGDFDNDGR